MKHLLFGYLGEESLALTLKHKEFSKETRLFYVKNLNNFYFKEPTFVQELAKDLDLELDFVEIPLTPIKNLPENPAKNFLSNVLAYEYYQKIPELLIFGVCNYSTTYDMKGNVIEEESTGVERRPDEQQVGGLQVWRSAGDSAESLAKESDVYMAAYGGCTNFFLTLKDEVEAYSILHETGFERRSLSCMVLDLWKSGHRKKLSAKYEHLPILDNPYSCGVCFKCVEQALIESKKLKVEYPPEYIRWCKGIIIKKLDNLDNLNAVDSTRTSQLFSKFFAILSKANSTPTGFWGKSIPCSTRIARKRLLPVVSGSS